MVMPSTLKINWPPTENTSNTPAATQHASRAVRRRCAGVSVGVMVRNAGTVASGSTITNSELAASKMYSDKLKRLKLGTIQGESQTRRRSFGHDCAGKNQQQVKAPMPFIP